MLVQTSAPEGTASGSDQAVETEAPAFTPEQLARWEADAEALRLSELMPKNHSTLRDEDGDFSDWLELENLSDRNINLEGWILSDGADGGEGWRFPAVYIGPGKRLIVFASGKDRAGKEMHTDFSLSEGESLSLSSPDGKCLFSVKIHKIDEDCSLILRFGSAYSVSAWPTPGQPNDAHGYDAWQESLHTPGPLVINEAMPANLYGVRNVPAGCDWVELKNISDESIELSDYFLSDDRNDFHLWRLPEGTLAPQQTCIIICEKDGAPGWPCAPFSLNAERETLFLSSDTGLCDVVSLHDVPFCGSCGRAEGEAGFFYFTDPSPGEANEDGFRRVSESPHASPGGGLYENTESLAVWLAAGGDIYYTLDGSRPTPESARYESPIVLTGTAVLRAISVEEGALPSRELTESYFINEGHTLPVVSLVADNYGEFLTIWQYKATESEIPGCIALYDPDESCRAGCGITMSGASSLELGKKNVSVHFRGAYGDSSLDCDIFGGGTDSFQSLTLRAGQDYYSAIIRNELCENLALQFSPDHVPAQRSRYCVLYVNGHYYGIYALKEKINRNFYASWAGVSKESVTVIQSQVPEYMPFGQEVYCFIMEHDMSLPENYAHLCEVADVDSMIDWVIIEGYTYNRDVASGNLRYARSTEGDGRWRLVLYDMDMGFQWDQGIFLNLLGPDDSAQQLQIVQILFRLLENNQFRAQFLQRASDAVYGPFSDENVLSEIGRLYGEIESEIPRDFARWGRSRSDFEVSRELLRSMIANGYSQKAVDDLCDLLHVTEQERERYFSEPLR